MKASLTFTLCALTLSSTVLSMQESSKEKWGDRVERLEREKEVSIGTHTSRKEYGTHETRVWRPKPIAQPSAQVTSEQRSLRAEPDRKSNLTKTHNYPADRSFEVPTPSHTELHIDAETTSKIAILYKLLPDIIEGNKTQKEQTEKTLGLFERMFLSMDQKIRDLQIAHSQSFLRYQAEANATIIRLQQQLCAQQQETHTVVVKNAELATDNADLRKMIIESRNLTKDRYEKIQKTLAKLDEKTHSKSTML